MCLKGRRFDPLVIVGRRLKTDTLSLVIPLLRCKTDDVMAIEYAFAGVTDYATPIVDPVFAREAQSASDILSQFRAALGRCDTLSIGPVRQSDLDTWKRFLVSDPIQLGCSSHCARSTGPFESWRRSNLSTTFRNQLDRKWRRLNDSGAVVLNILGPDAAEQAIGWASSQRQGRFNDDPLQGTEGLRFYQEVAAEGARTGSTRTYELTCDGTRVAICFGLIDQLCYRYLILACDYQRYGKFSPGLLILDRAMADWMSSGGYEFDFTIGDEAFKNHFARDKVPMYQFQETLGPVGSLTQDASLQGEGKGKGERV